MLEAGIVVSFELWCSDTIKQIITDRDIAEFFNKNFPHTLLLLLSIDLYTMYAKFKELQRNYSKLNIE